MSPKPVLVANIMGDDAHMRREVDRILAFARERGVPTGAWDCNWHSRYEHTVVDEWADLEEDFLEAGFAVVRASNGDWALFAPQPSALRSPHLKPR